MKIKKIILTIILIIVFTIIILEQTNKEKKQIIVEENGTINVLFCDIQNCRDEFITFLDDEKQIFCAFYELKDKKILEMTQKNNVNIKMHQTNNKGLMHHKFCVKQNQIITGSYNPTENNNHKENVIILESEIIAKNYLEEYKQINEIQKNEKIKTRTHTIFYNGYELNNYFCPQDHCKEKIVKELEKAQESIYFLTFTFTDQDISNVLIEKKLEGLDVKGITDNFQNKQYWVTPMLEKNNITVKINTKRELQHNKVFIIDQKTIITGSYNPTNAANTINDENILIIRQPEITQKYTYYFEYLFATINI